MNLFSETLPTSDCPPDGPGAAELRRLAVRLLSTLAERPLSPSEVELEPYLDRLGKCLAYHGQALCDSRPISWGPVIHRIEQGRLHYGRVSSNVLLDVILAAALEGGQAFAAEVFDRDYMPLVCSLAARVGGKLAVEAVENFAAVLVLPDDRRPARIATYQGRTPLATWLRPVVINYWYSECRRRKLPILTAEAAFVGDQAACSDDPAARLERDDCEQLLRPLLGDAVSTLQPEDRLLLKMLLLDGVPQGKLAELWGLNAGTLTRRRQRAAQRVLDGLRSRCSLENRQREFTDCLQLVVAGRDRLLCDRLAEVLAAAVRTSPELADGGDAP